MKILNLEQNSPEWLEARKGKITGSKLKDIVVKRGTDEKIGFYQLIADRLAIVDDSESPMDRGHSHEQAALDAFALATGKKVEKTGMWISSDSENIAVSPDGIIKDGKKIREAVEVKCLSAARHLEAYFTQSVPDEYQYQVIQYFIVNPDLERLFFCFYDPRVVAKPFFFITIERDEEQVEFLRQYQLDKLEKAEQLIARLVTF